MQKSIRIQQHVNPKDPKSNSSVTEDPKDPRISKKADPAKQNINQKGSPVKTKPPEKKEPEPPKYETNFSQESQNCEFLEKRVEVIIQEAVNIENEFGKAENEEDINFEERMQTITAKLQHIFEVFGNKQEELETWLRETLSAQIQGGLEKINGVYQGLENTIRERNDLQSQTSQALGLAVSVQKYLKENQKLWTMN